MTLELVALGEFLKMNDIRVRSVIVIHGTTLICFVHGGHGMTEVDIDSGDSTIQCFSEGWRKERGFDGYWVECIPAKHIDGVRFLRDVF